MCYYIEDVTLDPADLSLTNMKNIGAKLLVEAAKYIADNTQLIVNGFNRAGICQALDGQSSDDELDEFLCEMDSSEVMRMMRKTSCVLATVHNNQQAADLNAAFDKPVIVVRIFQH